VDEPVPEANKESETQPQGRREVGGPPGPGNLPATGTGRKQAAASIFDGSSRGIPLREFINVIDTR